MLVRERDTKIKACVIGSPKAPAAFILFLDWQVKQQVNPAFLVFDLLGGDASFQCERDARRFVHPKLDDPEETVGLIIGEEG